MTSFLKEVFFSEKKIVFVKNEFFYLKMSLFFKLHLNKHTQETFTCSKSTTETLGEGVKYVQN